MATNTTQHDCSDQGCLAAMLGVELAMPPTTRRRIECVVAHSRTSGNLVG